MGIVSVLLINPPRAVPQPADFPPMGLCYLAASLKLYVPARVLDAAPLSWRKLAAEIKNAKPDVIGISCWTIERGQAFETARIARQVAPQAKIIMGGHHATAFPQHMFVKAQADAVVLAEGEETIVELVGALAAGTDLSTVKGIAHLDGGECVCTPSRGVIADLDRLPFPDYSELDFRKYKGLPEVAGPSAAIITSRGCPYQCTFCSASRFWHRRWRYRSSESVLEEIQWLNKDFGMKSFLFFDDNFAVRKERAVDICRLILEKKLDISWVACTHVNHVDGELLRWMKKAGCYRIDYGVESGSPRILSGIKKGTNVEQVRGAFRLTHEAGIQPRAYLMVGNPGEDEGTVDETVGLMREIRPYNTPSGQILWVLPDTEIYELAKEKGTISDDFWLGQEDVVYYTGEHTKEQLIALRNRLMAGMARNRRSLRAYIEYLLRRVYYASRLLQRLYYSLGARRKSIFKWFRTGEEEG